MGNTCFSVVSLQHLSLPIIKTALLLVCRFKNNKDMCLVKFQKLVIAD